MKGIRNFSFFLMLFFFFLVEGQSRIVFIQTGHKKSNSSAIQGAQLISSFHAASELIIAMSAADACSGLSWLSSPFHMWEAEGWESTPLAFSVSIWKGREVPEQRQTTKLTFLPTEIPIFLWLHLNWHKVMWGKKGKRIPKKHQGSERHI